MLISIVIPVYNVEAYLSRCIDSVLSQTYRSIEVIVVDDGSTDKSLKILEEYKDDRLKIITKTNGGLSSARNEGLKNVHGEYITFIDSDDWVDETMVEVMVSQVNSYNADVVCVGEMKTYGDTPKDTLKDCCYVYNGEDCMSQLLSMNVHTYTWGKLYKASIFSHKECRFPEGYNYEDVATSYKFFRYCNTLVIVNKVLYYYYQRENSIVKTKRLVEVESLLYHLQEMQSYKISNLYWEYYQLKVLYGCFLYSLRLSNEQKKTVQYQNCWNSLNQMRNQIVLKKTLLWYLCKREFYKVFIVKTNLINSIFFKKLIR